MYDMVHAILLSTRDNVNFVNEVFHQVNVDCTAGILLFKGGAGGGLFTIHEISAMSPSTGHLLLLLKSLLCSCHTF